MSTISDSHYPNNEKNARMRDVSPAYNFGGSQYKKILGISDPAFSGGDEYVAYAEYLNERAERNKSADKMKKEWEEAQAAINNKENSTQEMWENYVAATKPKTKEEVANLIVDNAKYIKNAAKAYGVDPRIIAGVIYTEQVKNVNYMDTATDRLGFWGLFDTSIGLGQVKGSTAKFMEDLGYAPKSPAMDVEFILPVVGSVDGTETMTREMRLEDNRQNILYVAAYLKYFQDAWADQYPAIANDPAILGTLYNRGYIETSPHPTPQFNPFGSFVDENYNYMGELLGI
jgi:hypothetical protein